MIELKNLSKQFETLDGSVDALRNINLTIRDGDVYGIIGMSGAGKSTLVRCINMLERPAGEAHGRFGAGKRQGYRRTETEGPACHAAEDHHDLPGL